MPATPQIMYKPGEGYDPRKHPAFANATIVDASAGHVVVNPPRRKVAVVGFAESTRNQAPYDDPEWEIWGLNQLYRYTPRFDRWFEIHTREDFLADQVRDANYLSWLQQSPVPVYVQALQADIPMGVRYPIERILMETMPKLHRPGTVPMVGLDYFAATPSYMIALAMAEGFETIGVWGVDLIVGREWGYEKPGVEFLLGVAMGRGIKVVLPTGSALLKQRVRYGYPAPVAPGPISMKVLGARIAEYERRRTILLTQLNGVEGALLECREFQRMHELYLNGADYDENGLIQGMDWVGNRVQQGP